MSYFNNTSSTIPLGPGDGGTPSSLTLRGAAASGSNVPGADITFDASNGTGSGGSGSFVFRTAGSNVLPITLDAASGQSSGSNTMSFTVGSSGTNYILLVWATTYSGNTATAATFNSVSMTKLGHTANGNVDLSLFYLLAPSSGMHTISVTFNGGGDYCIGAQSYYNVLGIGSLNTNTGSGTSPSFTVSSATGQVVVDTIAVQGNNTDTFTATGSGQVKQYGTANNQGIGGSYSPGASSVTMSWTLANSRGWVDLAIPLLPPSGSTSDLLTERFRIKPDGTIKIVGNDVEYNGDNTVGNGLASITGNIALTGQTSNIGSTTLWTPPVNGTYLVGVYAVTSTAGTGGTLSSTITYNDDVQAQTITTISSLDLTTLGAFKQTTNYIRATTSNPIKYTATISGGTGSPVYDLFLNTIRLS